MFTNTEILADCLNRLTPSFMMTRDEWATLVDYGDLQRIRSGEVLSDIGDIDHALYFILEGEVLLTSGPQEEERVYRTLSPGVMAGGMSFFFMHPRTLRLKVSEDVLAVVLKRSMYQRLSIEHPFIAGSLLEYGEINQDQDPRYPSPLRVSDLPIIRYRKAVRDVALAF